MIYCVEDESAIRDLMVYTLKVSGFDAQGFENGIGFWAAMKEQKPELILLDVMLPGEDGLTILKTLHSSPMTADIPVIMATAKDSEYDKVVGLDSGADDYLVKPFGMMEMVSRIKAVLRRIAPKQANVLACGGITLDESRHSVAVCGTPVSLTLKEYELLKLFMENTDRVFTREVLLSEIWGKDFIGETRTVDVHIGTLRTKLARAGGLIETVRGVGYRMGERHELDRLFIHLYEDHVAGKVSEERFAMMSRNYEDEQQALKADMEQLRQDIEAQEQKNQDLELFIQKVKKYAELEELTAYAVHDLIKAIYIGAPDKSSGKRHQEIHIEYDNVGFIPLDRLMKQEMA